jgi:DNA-binding NtrC family response regulator
VKTILILDNDVGFVFWLGQALDRAGYQALPARNVSGALRLLAALSLRPDLLIVNFSLSGTAGLIDRLRESFPDLKVIALNENTPARLPGVDARRTRPDSVDGKTESAWLQAVKSLSIIPVLH